MRNFFSLLLIVLLSCSGSLDDITIQAPESIPSPPLDDTVLDEDSPSGGSSSGGPTYGNHYDTFVYLNANGTSAYSRIKSKFGSNSIELPDRSGGGHPNFIHITDDNQGFKFVIHRDVDLDVVEDGFRRQRNEIKGYSGSPDAMKAYNGEIATYAWRFKLGSSLKISKNFSHFFQIKGVNGDDGHPQVTISGAKKNGIDLLEIRHGNDDYILDETLFSEVKDIWLNVYVRAEYGYNGSLEISVHEDNGTQHLYYKGNIAMWRSGWAYARPKWGIYRSLKDSLNLNESEDVVWFDNFFIREGAEEQYKIRNKWTGNYIKKSFGNSIISSGIIDYSSSWTIEASPTSNYVLIRNLDSTAEYLKGNSNGSVTGENLVSKWSSMRWELIPSTSAGYYWIRNKYHGTYLRNNGSSVVVQPLISSYSSFRWKIQ